MLYKLSFRALKRGDLGCEGSVYHLLNSEVYLNNVFITRTDHLHQNYWFSGFCQSSGILNIRKHSVLETGSVSVLRLGEGGIYCIGSLRES
jgi:hypothetical protein